MESPNYELQVGDVVAIEGYRDWAGRIGMKRDKALGNRANHGKVKAVGPDRTEFLVKQGSVMHGEWIAARHLRFIRHGKWMNKIQRRLGPGGLGC